MAYFVMVGLSPYLSEIEKLWNDLKRLYDRRTESAPKFLFNEMAFETYKLLDKQKVYHINMRSIELS